jgi:hypothetical protein
MSTFNCGVSLGRGAGQLPVSEAPEHGAEDPQSSAAAAAQHSPAAMRELSTARTMGEPESRGRRDGDSLPSASSPLPDDGAEDDRSRSPEGSPGVPGVSVKMMEKFAHSAGAAPREDSSSPPTTLGADGHGPASWRPMAVGAAGFSASMAKFLHMQHKAAVTAAGKRKHEETEDCGGEDPAGLGQSARCSTDKALASGYKASPGYGGEKAARRRSESPSSSEHPLSINSTSSLLHSVNRAVPEDTSLEGGDGAEG